MRTVSAWGCARVQSRLSTAAVAAAFFSSVRRDVGMAFPPRNCFVRFSLLGQVFKGCVGKSTRSKGEGAAAFDGDFLRPPHLTALNETHLPGSRPANHSFGSAARTRASGKPNSRRTILVPSTSATHL